MNSKYKVIIPITLVVLLAAGCNSHNTASSSSTSQQTPAPSPSSTSPAAFLPDATTTAQSVSTVPANGDTNPYGVAFVPVGFPAAGGLLNPGDILVSNFNNSKNLQGTGTTIVKITPAGQMSVFFQGKGPLGLTTALAVLKSGFVIVGNMPTTDGTSATAKAGSLLIINSKGKLVTTLTDKTLINGPWDMAVNDNSNQVQAFVSNALSGTVVRFDLTFNATGLTAHTGTVIGSGYVHHGDPNALVIGPTGLFYNPKDGSLLVASTGDNAVYSIANAATATTAQTLGTVVYQDNQHLRGPLGLAQAPNGDFLVTNGDAVNPDSAQSSEIVEFTPSGRFVKQLSLDPAPGAAFGMAVNAGEFAAVEDNTASLLVWAMPLQ